MPSDPTLDELGRLTGGLRLGEPEAFTRVHELTVDLLEAIARGMLGSDAAAQDAVQDVFLKLVRHHRRLRADDGRQVRAWLVTATRNRCRDELRRRRRRGEDLRDELPELVDEAVDPAALLVEAENTALRAALATLPEQQRAVLVLRHVGGLDGHELAEALGRSRGAAYALLSRAERALRAAMDETSNPTTGQRPQAESGATT